MIRLVEQTIKKYNLLCNSDKVIVALSGGADSVALLNVLYSLKEKYNLTIYAAHINHNLRGEEAARDENFCKILCKKYNIELFVKSADVKAVSKEQKISEELCGRNIRYSFFDELSKKLGAKVATAHTASDNAETLIFNITRGSSIGGMCAIVPKRNNIIRPLIEASRVDIENYCADNNLEYVTDSTNLADDYTRNNIRHNIIPQLKSINPSFEKSVMHLSESAREINEFLEKTALKALEDCKTNYGYSCNQLVCLDIAILKHAILILLKNYSVNLEQKHIALICDIIKNGGSVELSKDYTAISKQGVFRIANNTSKNAELNFNPISLNKNVEFTYNSKHYSLKENCLKNSINSISVEFLDTNAVFRTRREKDKFTYPDRNITKPLRKVLNELKIPSEQRDKLVVLALDNIILWCEGVGASLQGMSNGKTMQIEIKNEVE